MLCSICCFLALWDCPSCKFIHKFGHLQCTLDFAGLTHKIVLLYHLDIKRLIYSKQHALVVVNQVAC